LIRFIEVECFDAERDHFDLWLRVWNNQDVDVGLGTNVATHQLYVADLFQNRAGDDDRGK